jgi:hypothetical protein
MSKANAVIRDTGRIVQHLPDRKFELFSASVLLVGLQVAPPAVERLWHA